MVLELALVGIPTSLGASYVGVWVAAWQELDQHDRWQRGISVVDQIASRMTACCSTGSHR